MTSKSLPSSFGKDVVFRLHLLLTEALLLLFFLPTSLADGGSFATEASHPGVIHPLFPFRLKKTQDAYSLEFACGALAFLIIANYLRGRFRNEKLAVDYTAALLRDESPICRSFAVAPPELRKVGPDLFTVYVSGRRYCHGMLLTFKLARRQDLVAVALASASKDILDVEVAMNPASLPLTVLFVGSYAAAKVVTEENRDIVDLAKRLEPTRDRLVGWPSDLVVHAEHASIFYDMMSGHAMDLFFGPAAFDAVGHYFRFLHVTSEYAFGEHRQKVHVSFSLPPAEDIATLDRFMNFVTFVIDILGAYKLNPEQTKRATDARAKAETQRPNAVEEMAKRVEERRIAKEAEEKARLARLPPDQRAKEVARKQKILKERKMRSMVKKV